MQAPLFVDPALPARLVVRVGRRVARVELRVHPELVDAQVGRLEQAAERLRELGQGRGVAAARAAAREVDADDVLAEAAQLDAVAVVRPGVHAAKVVDPPAGVEQRAQPIEHGVGAGVGREEREHEGAALAVTLEVEGARHVRAEVPQVDVHEGRDDEPGDDAEERLKAHGGASLARPRGPVEGCEAGRPPKHGPAAGAVNARPSSSPGAARAAPPPRAARRRPRPPVL